MSDRRVEFWAVRDTEDLRHRTVDEAVAEYLDDLGRSGVRATARQRHDLKHARAVRCVGRTQIKTPCGPYVTGACREGFEASARCKSGAAIYMETKMKMVFDDEML